MNGPIDIVLCADHRVLPGLHVAMYSLLDRLNPGVKTARFTVFSEQLAEPDLVLLQKTLQATGRNFSLELRRITATAFDGFPPLNGSHAAYYRLFAAQAMAVERFLYVDADTLCDVDVGELWSIDLGNHAVGWVPEAPLATAVDRAVAEQLGNSPEENYFNSGLLLINTTAWHQQKVTEKSMAYIAAQHPDYHDQSALNVVLHGNAVVLDAKFNCIANMRQNWPALRRPYGQIGRLVHFVDYPKPWDWMAKFIHPQRRLWRQVLAKTAMKDLPSWPPDVARRRPATRKAWNGYKKTLKDRVLFDGYVRGWLKTVKGIPQT